MHLQFITIPIPFDYIFGFKLHFISRKIKVLLKCFRNKMLKKGDLGCSGTNENRAIQTEKHAFQF